MTRKPLGRILLIVVLEQVVQLFVTLLHLPRLLKEGLGRDREELGFVRGAVAIQHTSAASLQLLVLLGHDRLPRLVRASMT